MDRLHPRIYNIDYWHLVAIRRAIAAFVAKYGDRIRGGRVLDFGASMCPYAELFTAAGATMLPADIGDVPPGTLKISDEGRVPLDDGSVEMVLSTQVLEHVPFVGAYLSEAYRVCKPGGLLLLTTHGTWQLHRVPTDMRRWTIDGLRFDVEQAGFKVESVDPYIGRMATCTYQRMVAISELLRHLGPLNFLRVVTNAVGNFRMGIEEKLTTRHGREALQQILMVTAFKPVG